MPIVGNSYYNDPNIGAGFTSLAQAFAPPSTSEIATAATIQQAQAKAAANASSLAKIAAGQGTTADYLQIDPGGGVKQQVTAEGLQQLKSGGNFPALDKYVFLRDGNAENTFAGMLSKPMSEGQTRTLPPSVASLYRLPQTTYGSQNVAEGATRTLPGQNGMILPPAAATPDTEDGAPMPLAGAGMRMPPGSTGNITLQGQEKASKNELTQDKLKALIMQSPDDPKWTPEQKAWAKQSTGQNIHLGADPAIDAGMKRLDKMANEAESAAGAVRSIQSARAQLTGPGGVIAGFGADPRLTLQKIGAYLGAADPNAIVNTETFKTQIKPLVLETVKGLGSGTGISNADRDFALQAVGGDMNLDPQTLARVLDITERANREKIVRHNTRVKSMFAKSPSLEQVSPMLLVDEPEITAKPANPGTPTTTATAAAGTPGTPQPKQAPDGKFYVPDPARPGKFLEVRQ
jgi:hypothetical protein